MQTHIDELIEHPQRHFDHPSEVLREPTLTKDEKRRILESWKLDAQRLAESTAENMSGGEESDLRDVSKTLVELDAIDEVPRVTQQPPRTSMRGVGTAMILGGVIGAGAGLLIAAVSAPSLAVVAQATVAGLIIGGVAAAVRNAVRS
ncbi:MAG TPA: hypothetical protein VFV70_08485 [Hyphomonadaceae bacterium]|nr:hypothetical protein [Hyphomonadaceae bacterium]